MENEKKTRRPGGGRKPQNPKQGAKVKVAITMTRQHHQLTAGNRSGMIETALDFYFKPKPADIEQEVNNAPAKLGECACGAKAKINGICLKCHTAA